MGGYFTDGIVYDIEQLYHDFDYTDDIWSFLPPRRGNWEVPVEIILRDPGKWTTRLQTAVNALTELTSTLTDRAIERVPANDEFKDEARIMQRQFRESIQDMEIVLKRLRATEQAEPKLTVQQHLDNMAALFRDPTPPPLEPERAPAPMMTCPKTRTRPQPSPRRWSSPGGVHASPPSLSLRSTRFQKGLTVTQCGGY